jgi:hypothetical protein
MYSAAALGPAVRGSYARLTETGLPPPTGPASTAFGWPERYIDLNFPTATQLHPVEQQQRFTTIFRNAGPGVFVRAGLARRDPLETCELLGRPAFPFDPCVPLGPSELLLTAGTSAGAGGRGGRGDRGGRGRPKGAHKRQEGHSALYADKSLKAEPASIQRRRPRFADARSSCESNHGQPSPTGVVSCRNYGARSWTGVHMSKCPNAALKAIPRTAKATTTTALELILKRGGFLNRRSPDMLHSPRWPVIVRRVRNGVSRQNDSRQRSTL